jgi:hypothetical protein
MPAPNTAAAAFAAPVLAGIGGRIADDLKHLGMAVAADLQRLGEQQLLAVPSVRPNVAAQLAGWGHGRDGSAVVDKGPPKSLQVHGAAG